MGKLLELIKNKWEPVVCYSPDVESKSKDKLKANGLKKISCKL